MVNALDEKSIQAATLVRALTSQQIELRGATAPVVRVYRVEFNNETPGSANPAHDDKSKHDRALIAQQAAWQTEMGTTNPGL